MIERSKEWWRAKAEAEGEQTIGAGAKPLSPLVRLELTPEQVKHLDKLAKRKEEPMRNGYGVVFIPTSWHIGVWRRPTKTLWAFGPLRFVRYRIAGEWGGS